MRQSPYSAPIHSAHRNVASAGVGLVVSVSDSRACSAMVLILRLMLLQHRNGLSSLKRLRPMVHLLIDGPNLSMAGIQGSTSMPRHYERHGYMPGCVDGEATDAGNDFARHQSTIERGILTLRRSYPASAASPVGNNLEKVTDETVIRDLEKYGASSSLLMATMTFESFIPARCWIAPEIPAAT